MLKYFIIVIWQYIFFMDIICLNRLYWIKFTGSVCQLYSALEMLPHEIEGLFIFYQFLLFVDLHYLLSISSFDMICTHRKFVVFCQNKEKTLIRKQKPQPVDRKKSFYKRRTTFVMDIRVFFCKKLTKCTNALS